MGSKSSSHFKDRVALPGGHTDKVVDVRFSPKEEYLVSVGGDSTACVWKVPKQGASWKAPFKFELPGPYGQSVDINSKGKIAVARSDNIISIHGRGLKHSQDQLRRHTEPVSCARFNVHREQYLLSGSLDGTTIMWDLTKKIPETTFAAKGTGGCTKVAWSNGSVGEKVFLASYTDATVRLFDGREKKQSMTFAGHDSDVNSVAWSRDDAFFASASADSKVCLWDLKKADKPRQILSAPQIKGGAQDVSIGCGINGVSRSVDECFVYVAYEQSPYFVAWPVPNTGRNGAYMSPLLSKRVSTVEVGPSGRYFATGDWGNQVIVWDTEEVKKAEWHTGGIIHM